MNSGLREQNRRPSESFWGRNFFMSFQQTDQNREHSEVLGIGCCEAGGPQSQWGPSLGFSSGFYFCSSL